MLADIERELRSISSFRTERGRMETQDKITAFNTQGLQKSFKKFDIKKGPNGHKGPNNNSGFRNKITNSKFDQRKPGQPNPHKGKECSICKRKGHISTDCWFKDQANTAQITRGRSNQLSKNEIGSDDEPESLDTTFLTQEEATQKSVSPEPTGDVFAAFKAVPSSSSWIVDSGATAHMCNDRSLFKELSDKTPIANIEVANGNKARVEGTGSVRLSTTSMMEELST
jgi:hypothetical protein